MSDTAWYLKDRTKTLQYCAEDVYSCTLSYITILPTFLMNGLTEFSGAYSEVDMQTFPRSSPQPRTISQ